MSDMQIVLEVVDGCLKGNRYCFDGPARLLIGRGRGCDIQFPDDMAAASVSPYHCILDFDPPSIHVRDLDSHAGTYLNGAPIGPPSMGSQADLDFEHGCADGEMTDGDELRVGANLFVARVFSNHHTPDAALAPIYYG
jgi:eukaryotic-like serine/threonine-protein kinase